MIFVLSGTKDGRLIIDKLLEENYKVLSSTATTYGKTLIESHPNLKVISDRLSEDDIKNIINKNKVKLLLDATHPYAKEISNNAIKACKELSIPYIRYERESIDYKNIKKCKSYDDVVNYLRKSEGNILLTTGSNNLDKFSNLENKENIYVRVLPTPNVIEKCYNLGFLPKQILGLQGPFTKDFNKATLKQYNIKYMVTKDSGDIGGTNEKIEAALECGVEVIVIDRPDIEYQNIYFDIDKLISEVNKYIK